MKKYIFILIGVFWFACSGPKEGLKTLQQTKEVVYAQAESFQMAPPIIQVDSVLFSNSCAIELIMNHPGAQMYFSLDGSEVTEQSDKYTGPFLLKSNASIKARTFHPDLNPSASVALQIFKVIKNDDLLDVSIEPKAHDNYPGGGGASLFDLKKGSLNFRDGTFWSGFQAKEVKLSLRFNQMRKIKKLHLSLLKDHASWIFLPNEVIVYSGEKVIANTLIDFPDKESQSKLEFITLSTKEVEIEELKIVIKSLSGIPEWHPGKGSPPWLFIDEIIIE